MESTGAGNRLWRIARLVLYMIRKGLSKDKPMMDLHLLRKRGKVIGKALANLMTLHHHRGCRRCRRHHHHSHGVDGLLKSGFYCRSLDPDVPFYDPREVEFSCSTTPTYPSFYQNRHHHRYDDYETMAFAEALEMLDYEEDCAESSSVAPSPSPTSRLWRCQKSPVTARRLLRVTDSPFPVKEEEHIDEEAEQFIRRFHEQLRLQQMMNPMTPEYKHCWNDQAVMGRA